MERDRNARAKQSELSALLGPRHLVSFSEVQLVARCSENKKAGQLAAQVSAAARSAHRRVSEVNWEKSGFVTGRLPVQIS